MCRLVWAFVVHKPPKTGFLLLRPNCYLQWCTVNCMYHSVICESCMPVYRICTLICNCRSFMYSKWPLLISQQIYIDNINMSINTFMLNFSALINWMNPSWIEVLNVHYVSKQCRTWSEAALGLYGFSKMAFSKERKKKIFFLFLNQNICCRYSKEPSP